MKIIITGSSGFVGNNIVHHFNQTIQNDLIKVNLRDKNWKFKIESKATSIIHLAGKAHDIKNTYNPKEYFDVNTTLTQNIFDIFLESNCRDFIFFSSIKAVTDQTDEILIEGIVTNPKTAYGQSKRLAEQYILSKLLPKGKRVFIIRPAMIHGPGNKGNLNLLYKLAIKGIPWPLGTFDNNYTICPKLLT